MQSGGLSGKPVGIVVIHGMSGDCLKVKMRPLY